MRISETYFSETFYVTKVSIIFFCVFTRNDSLNTYFVTLWATYFWGMKTRQVLKKLFQYFLQGLIILAPIIITIYAVTALFNFIDNILPDLLGRLFPHWVDSDGHPNRIPGIGFVIVILTVVIVGYVSSSFIVGRMVDLLDKVLERTLGH